MRPGTTIMHTLAINAQWVFAVSEQISVTELEREYSSKSQRRLPTYQR
jgi:hypothetical protein